MAARDQYFIHSRRYEDLGLEALYQRLNHEMEEETEHADAAAPHPVPGRRAGYAAGCVQPGTTVEQMLEKDLATEYAVRKNLADGIALCERHGDYASRQILVEQLKDTEEDHAYWLEKQLRLIRMIGLERYQQSQMRGGQAD